MAKKKKDAKAPKKNSSGKSSQTAKSRSKSKKAPKAAASTKAAGVVATQSPSDESTTPPAEATATTITEGAVKEPAKTGQSAKGSADEINAVLRQRVRRTGRRIPRRRRTVVITGISGRLGNLLARRLHRDPNVDVIGIDRRTFHRKPRDVEHLQVDIRRNKCEELFRSRRVDAIFHLGLMHNPRQNPDEHHSWNIVGTQRVFEYAQRYRVAKVVLLSSADVYGPQPDNPAFISEDAPLLGARRFPQIRDLISVDMLAQSYFWKAPEIETVVLRPVHILGGVDNAISKYLRMQRVPVLMGFDPMMQVIHEEDAVSAVWKAARPGIRGVLNVRGPEGLPLRALIDRAGKPTVEVPHLIAPTMARRLYQARLIDMPAAELDYVRYAVTVDGRRAEKLLKFKPRYSVDAAIDAVLRRGIFDGALPAPVVST